MGAQSRVSRHSMQSRTCREEPHVSSSYTLSRRHGTTCQLVRVALANRQRPLIETCTTVAESAVTWPALRTSAQRK